MFFAFLSTLADERQSLYDDRIGIQKSGATGCLMVVR